MKPQHNSQEILNQANQFIMLRVNLSQLVKLSRVPEQVKIKGSGFVCRSNYYRKLKDNNFDADQLIGIFKAIVEFENQEFDELQTGLSELVELSNVPFDEKVKGSGMASGHFYRKLTARSFNAKQLIGIFRSIIEHGNITEIKNRTLGI